MEIRHIFHTFVITLVLLIKTTKPHNSCGLYGEPPCIFVPAPPGQTPHCARPGTTFCEHVANYPAE
uniref:VM domain-containing protein n=1 Tax=Megaselia scalaris TaxID=36166 RepID=T1GLP0_MEGSC